MPHIRRVAGLFVDLVGSTRIGERLGPDQVRLVIGHAVTRYTEIVQAFGGYVEAFMGDGIAAFFGVTQANPDDVVRAAETALEVVRETQRLERETPSTWGAQGLAVRVGLNVGRAAVDAIGTAPGQLVALGDAVNAAARLQGLAAPNQILVGEECAHELARAGYELRPIGPREVRNRDAPLNVWELVGRPAGRVLSSDPPFVGRSAERARLEGVFEECRAGCGSVVTVVGESGIGKTRLVREFAAERAGSARVLYATSSGYGWRSSYQTLRSLLRSGLDGLRCGSELETATTWECVRDSLRLSDDAARTLRRLLLLDWTREWIRLDSGRPSREEAFLAVEELMRSFADEGEPILVVLDACEDGDEDVRQTGTWLLRLTEELPLCVILVMQPKVGSVGWELRTLALTEFFHRSREIVLSDLPDDEALRIVDAIDAHGGIAAPQRHAILRLAKGQPLFVEELARLLTAGRSSDLSELESLGRLDSCVLARFDRASPEEKAVLEAASCVGDRVEDAVMRRVAHEGWTREVAASLVRQGWWREARAQEGHGYEFRHPVMREVIEKSLLSDVRRRLHGEIGRALESHDSGTELTARLEELARHFSASSEPRTGARYCELAALSASESSDLPSAMHWGRRAAELYGQLEDADGWLRSMHVAHRSAIELGLANEAAELLSSMRPHLSHPELEERMEETVVALVEAGDLDAARGWVADLSASREGGPPDPTPVLTAHIEFRAGDAALARRSLAAGEEAAATPRLDLLRGWLMAGLAVREGDVDAAHAWARRSLSPGPGAGDGPFAWKARIDLTVLEMLTGNLAAAEAALQQVLSTAMARMHLPTLGHAGNNLVYLLGLQGRLEEARTTASRVLRWVTDDYWRANLLFNRGVAELAAGDLEPAERTLSTAAALAAQAGDADAGLNARWGLAMLAHLLGRSGADHDLAALADEGDLEMRLTALTALCHVFLDLDRPHDALGAAEGAVALAERGRTPLRVAARLALGRARAATGDDGESDLRARRRPARPAQGPRGAGTGAGAGRYSGPVAPRARTPWRRS